MGIRGMVRLGGGSGTIRGLRFRCREITEFDSTISPPSGFETMKENDLISALNSSLSDLHVLNVKLHNYHWNVQGLQFRTVHEMTEGYYNYVFGLFDEVAERVLQLGAKPFSTVADYVQNATLEEEIGNRFSAETVLERILEDFEKLLAEARHIVELADKFEDVPTGNLYGDHVTWLEKEIWMLKASLA